MTRKQANLPSRFWDDCGVWDARQGRSLNTPFVRNPAAETATLQQVRHVDGQFCLKRHVDKKIVWLPLEPQPKSDDVVLVHSYYASLKACRTYRKRVTWFDAKPEVAFVEYLCEPPATTQPRGLSRANVTEYV